jgi:hypothetical protein
MVLSMVAAGAAFAAPAAAQTDAVQEDEVSIGGSTVTVNTGGANSISVSDLPAGVEVTDVSDGGLYKRMKVLSSTVTLETVSRVR